MFVLNMKFWYVLYLEFLGGIGLKGVILVVIRLSEYFVCKEIESFVLGVFEELFKIVINLLVK